MTKRKIDPTDRKKICELAAQYYLEDLKLEGPLKSPDDTEQFLLAHFYGEKQEIFAVIFLDTRHRILAVQNMFFGTVDGAAVYPRVIVQKALEHNAAAIILAHNHPSGIAEPSMADHAITQRIKDALALVDICLLDHFVAGKGVAISMAQKGML
jgi:DNA repair protein RadC